MENIEDISRTTRSSFLCSSNMKDRVVICFSICFSTLVNFEKKLQKSQMEEIILVEVPKTIYPEIRSTLIFLFEKSGFKEVNLQKEIDFKKLYLSKKSQ